MVSIMICYILYIIDLYVYDFLMGLIFFRSWRPEKPKSKSYFCFAVVFNSKSKKTEDLPVFSLGGIKSTPIYLETHYPENAPEIYLGFDLTDRVACTKINSSYTLPHSLIPQFRLTPNHEYIRHIKSKFNRARHGSYQLCFNKAILKPSITRLFKTLQRSTLLYALEFSDWDYDQINELETLQAKALRTCLSSDLQCPQATVRLISGVPPFEARRDLHTLIYFVKLCKSDDDNFLGMINQCRISNDMLPVGFYRRSRNICSKYGLVNIWDKVNQFSYIEVK